MFRFSYKQNTMVLLPNRRAPEFEGKAVVNGEIKTIKSSDYMGKYLVIFFYPADL